ncbi:hypothetical protein CHS0354_025817 [Potamilus streckersoni]|uniref:RING-type domain-containing protein n=1 Tax=Potamilus streckersoni TaxID=2493646 RepID=A0AAE0W8A7_9BIVA|nr:hypothetical protein CHS0354_025817 [Potamilus streckersoni]
MAEGNPTCSICLKTFTNPVTIPCNHIFCSGCLKTYEEKNAREGSFACPLCNREVTVAPEVVSPVKKEDTDQRDASKDEICVKCDVCGPKLLATRRCLECEENYCQVCSVTHLKMKASRNHILYELGQLPPQENVSPHYREFCTKHTEEELKIVCKTCKNIPLCLHCKLSAHDNHTSRILAEEVAEIKKTLQKNLTLCAVRLEQLQIFTKEAEAFESKIDQCEQDEVMKINKQEQELISLLENKQLNIKQEAQKFKEKIKIIYLKIRRQNNLYKKQLANEFSNCVTMKDEAKKLTDTAKESQIAQRGFILTEDLLEESKQTSKIKLLGIQNKAFTPAGRQLQTLRLSMGDISTDIIKERKMNIFLKSCVEGQPMQLIEVKDDENISDLKKRVIDKYSLLPEMGLVLKLNGEELIERRVWVYGADKVTTNLVRCGIKNCSIIECFWNQFP